MTSITKDTWLEAYNNSPKEIQEWMGSDDVVNTILDIQKKHNLNSVKCRKLTDVIGEVLIGLLHPKDFITNLIQELEITTETAQTIAKEVNQKIFSTVKDLLIEIYGLGETTNKAVDAPKEIQNSTPSPDLFEKKLKQSVLAAPTSTATKIPVAKEGEETATKQQTPQKDSYREPIE